MRLDRYSALAFSGIEPSTLAPSLAAWVLPEDWRGKRRRQRTGVIPTWKASDLLEPEDLSGEEGCLVKTRWATDRSEYLLRFVHRDENAPEVYWHTMFRLSKESNGTLLETAVAREAPRWITLEPKAGSPRVIADLVKAHESSVRPREFTLPPLNAQTDDDVEALVDSLLLLSGRTVPVVLVARDVNGGEAAVDLDVIARHMQGIAVIASLDGFGATSAFERILTARGYSALLRCFNGAVHSYGSSAALETDHRLWLRRSLEALPESTRSDYVGETLARHLSLDRAPPNFLFSIEDFDRRERALKRAEQRAAAISGPASGLPEVQKLEEELRIAEVLLLEVEERASKAEEARRAAEQRCESAELAASTEQTLRENMQDQLSDRRAVAAAEALSTSLLEGLRVIVGKVGAPSPEQALYICEALYSDRVIILPEAFDSARAEGARFRKPDEVWDLLRRLCTGYYDGLQKGGDTVAKSVFSGREYASKGSDTEMNSRSCVRDRTRHYKGHELVMWPHLRAGGKGAAEDCLRIHFIWLPAEKKIVIGHCGAHLKET